MFICFACPACKTHLEIECNASGSQIVCPKCSTALTVPKAVIGPGVTLGGFRIERTLGRGGMGEVYLACQKSMDRKIALKVLPRTLTVQQDAVDRFRSEVRVLAQLKNPNIVTAYEAGEDDGVHFLAMEYVEGESLEQVLKRGNPLPEKQALGLTLKLSEALGHVWADHAMVHRDIKPANILLDRHGEPKLADMGLSKIASSQPGMTMAGEVMGTPNYMSPEQADGLAGVDFRADMYALGATLYHMLTARVPFGGTTFVETVRKQASEKLPNPRTINPNVSPACVALLEIMLARRANRRHATWEALSADIHRVLAGKLPATAVPAEGESLLQHSKTDSVHRKVVRKAGPTGDKPKPLPAATPEPEGHGGIIAAVIIGLALVVGLCVFLSSTRNTPRAAAAVNDWSPGPDAAAPRAPTTGEGQPRSPEQAYMDAIGYGQMHPGDPIGYLRRLQVAQTNAAGTEFEGKAAQEIARIKATIDKRKIDVWNGLKADFDQKWAAGKTKEAVELVETYHGPFAQELLVPLSELAQFGRTKLESRWTPMTTTAGPSNRPADLAAPAAARAPESHRQLDTALDEVAALLLKGDDKAAETRLSEAHRESPLQAETNVLQATSALLAGGILPREAILDSFAASKGQTVEVTLKTGKRVQLQIGRLEAGKVVCFQNVEDARIEQRLSPEDLSATEQLSRIGDARTPELSLARGLLLTRVKKPKEAQAEFEGMGAPLGQALIRVMDREATPAAEPSAPAPLPASTAPVAPTMPDQPPREVTHAAPDAAAEAEAAKAYLALLETACPELAGQVGASEVDKDQRMLVSAIAGKKYAEVTVTNLRRSLTSFKARFHDTAFAQTHSRVLNLLQRVRANGPLLVDESVVKKAAAAMARTRPGLDLAACTQIENDGLVVDLSRETSLYDLTPLAALPVKDLDITDTGVTSLVPLENMPLESLAIGGTNLFIRGFLPLQGLPLRRLTLGTEKNGVAIGTLAPFKGLPLEDLHICLKWNTPFDGDLSPLRGMRLRTLSIRGAHTLTSFGPLSGMPITDLSVVGAGVKDLKPLKGMPLDRLDLASSKSFTDLSPLRGSSLTSLDLTETAVSDLTPLHDTRLTNLVIRLTAVRDLSPLKGLPLTHLDISGCLVTDLSALKDLPLESLNIAESKVTDLSPLEGTHMDKLDAHGCKIKDFAPASHVSHLSK